MCLWGLFQTGGSEDVRQLLGDWWSESGRGGEAPRAPGGAGLQEELGSRRSWAQEDDNIKPACSTRMSIGGRVDE